MSSHVRKKYKDNLKNPRSSLIEQAGLFKNKQWTALTAETKDSISQPREQIKTIFQMRAPAITIEAKRKSNTKKSRV